jgi:hypothetical protein
MPISRATVSTLIVGLIIGYFTHFFLVTFRECVARRRGFRVFLRSVLMELDAMDFDDALKSGNPAFLYDWQRI